MAINDNVTFNNILNIFNNQALNLGFESVYNLNTTEDMQIVNSQTMNNVDTSTYDVTQKVEITSPESINDFIDFLLELQQFRNILERKYTVPRVDFKYTDFVYVRIYGIFEYFMTDILFKQYLQSKVMIEYDAIDKSKICTQLYDMNFKPLDDFLFNKIINAENYDDIKDFIDINYNVIMNYNYGDFKSYDLHVHQTNRILLEITNQEILRNIVYKIRRNNYGLKFNFVFDHNSSTLPLYLGHNLYGENIIRRYIFDIIFSDILINLKVYIDDGNLKSLILILE